MSSLPNAPDPPLRGPCAVACPACIIGLPSDALAAAALAAALAATALAAASKAEG